MAEHSAFTPDTELLEKLAPKAQELYDRHIQLSDANQWYPHKEVPWTYAQDFNDGYAWDPDALPVSPQLVSALFVNLLTEDNLPYYFQDLDKMFGVGGVWDVWNKRWTSEEMKHSMTMRDGLTATRLIDPVQLEDDRMVQVAGGVVPQLESSLDGFAYVALQELATRVSHRKTAKRLEQEIAGLEDPTARKALNKVGGAILKIAGDENLHYMFYKDLMLEALRVAPAKAMVSVLRVVRNFEMPGTGIPEFARRAEDTADLGVYDGTVHYENIVRPLLTKGWNIETRDGLGQEGKAAQKDISRFLKVLERAAKMDRLKRQSTRLQLKVI